MTKTIEFPKGAKRVEVDIEKGIITAFYGEEEKELIYVNPITKDAFLDEEEAHWVYPNPDGTKSYMYPLTLCPSHRECLTDVDWILFKTKEKAEKYVSMVNSRIEFED